MKFAITTLFCFIFRTAESQLNNPTRTYDFLIPLTGWKLVTKPSGSFTVTTNQLFWPDTATILKGKVIKTNSSISFQFDTLHQNNNDLGVLNFIRNEFLAQGNHLPAIKNFILFKSWLGNVKRALTFPAGAAATYYRGDGTWSNLIELKRDGNYEIRESVHGKVEYTETGVWKTDNGFVVLQADKKGQIWLKEYCDDQRLYLSQDFLIGRKTSKGERRETYYYFNKLDKK